MQQRQMNIIFTNNLYSFSNSASSIFKETISPILTPKQKGVALVALAAFICIATCYALYYSFCNRKAPGIDVKNKKNGNQGGAVIETDLLKGKEENALVYSIGRKPNCYVSSLYQGSVIVFPIANAIFCFRHVLTS